MAGSGIEQLFGLIYGSNTVQHVFSSKAYTRAVRAHFLLEGALTTLLLQNVFPSDHSDL